MMQKCFIIDFKYGEKPVDTALFDWETQQPEAEAFCKRVKEKGGAVNIKIREVGNGDKP